MSEQFYFEDFFVSQDDTDEGEEVIVQINGRDVPIHLKRGLSLCDRNAAKEKAVVKRIKPNGQIEITDINEGLFQLEMLSRSIKSWPFKYRDGRPVKVTKDNVQLLLADAADSLSKVVMGRLSKRDEAMQDFTTPSEQS